MIYEMDDDYIDTSKIERISNIKEEIFVPGGNKKYWFKYQINGYVYDSDFKSVKNTVILQRNAIIKAWKEYKGKNDEREIS